MKSIKKLSLVAAVLAFATVASAAMSDYNIYVGAGINMFKPSNDSEQTNIEDLSYDNMIGFNGGALGYIKMADMISLRTGVFYAMKNFKITDWQNTSGTNEVKISYIDIPVTLSYSMNKMAHIYAGVNVSFKINFSDDKEGFADAADFVTDDNLKSFLLAGTIGGQFNVTDRMGIDVYAEMGFGSILDIEDNDEADGDDNDIAKNPIGFGARALYRF